MFALAHGYAAPRIYGGLVSMAAERLGAAVDHVAREWQVRRDLRAVSALSDGALADIGIGRGAEEAAVRGGRRQARSALAASTPVAPLMTASWTEWR